MAGDHKTLTLQERLDVLFAQTKFCPVCGSELRIEDSNYFKTCRLGCGLMSFSDGDCTNDVTACFSPGGKLFDGYLA